VLEKLPQAGDTFHCEKCGMLIEVKVDCRCDHDTAPEFRCCGGELRPGGDADETLAPEAARGDYTG
jgi:hypothetical protein